ncbi:M24 family metallopeptidase [Candidatus Fermentibacteria bacterium]|nr:M24 family metallopeptidase [Candidatus Fermentibacteria bacterium]
MLFDALTYNERRQRLLQRLPDSFVAVLPPSSHKRSSADGRYPYVPNVNLLYLTGIATENVWLIMWKAPPNDPGEALFVDRPNEHYTKWVGEQLTPEKAAESTGIEKVLYNDQVEAFIDKKLIGKQIDELYLDYPLPGVSGVPSTRAEFAHRLASRYPHLPLTRLSDEVFALRMLKEDGEVDLIRKAIDLSRRGLERAMGRLTPGMIECEFEAEMRYEWTKSGEREPAFQPIVAGGGRAACLHYSDNDSELEDGQLLLLDFGARYRGYNADISRTVPVNGRYSDRQRKLVEMVIDVQAEAIKLLRPGKTHGQWNAEVNERYSKRLIREGLIEREEDLEQVYYHRIGHHLGLDTHDEHLRYEEIRPGMVFTVEPGLYMADENLGIRIEDDVLVGERKNEVLSVDIPKTPDEIERLMRK